MVTDALLRPLLGVLQWVIDTLPVWSPNFGSVSAIVVWIGRVDSLVPIAGPLSVMLGVLAFGVVFVLVRMVLLAWNLVWP